MQEGQLLLCWFFYPNKHNASSFYLYKPFIFAIISEHAKTDKFKIFANIVYPVQIITSEVTISWFDKNKNK